MRSSRGFSLIDMAIVMVIISFVLGGVVRGQVVTASAESRRVAADFRAIALGIDTYIEAYHSLPGDDRLATERFGNGTPSGNGNGMIDGRWNSRQPTDESVLVWQHLRTASILHGNVTVAATGTPGSDSIARDAFGRIVGVQSLENGEAAPIQGMRGRFALCTQGVLGPLAKAIDDALDDGVPDRGRMLSAPVDAVAAGAATPSSTFIQGELLTICMGF